MHTGVALGGAPRVGQTTAPILGIELALRQVDYCRRGHELRVIAQQLQLGLGLPLGGDGLELTQVGGVFGLAGDIGRVGPLPVGTRHTLDQLVGQLERLNGMRHREIWHMRLGMRGD
jgi:hypothetical protein